MNGNNPNGCKECFCSGASRQCSESRLYREQIPMIIFEDKFSIVSYQTQTNGVGDIQPDYAKNELSYQFDNIEKTETLWYWNLPKRFLGNQVLSYGGNFTVSQKTDGYGQFRHDDDIIITGNGVKIVHSRPYYVDGVFSIELVEDNFQTKDRGSQYATTRAEILTVLANIESFLVRATLKQETDTARISDIILDTAVTHNNGIAAPQVEECDCPEGYRGTSCEVSVL